MGRPSSGKRERLITAALESFHEAGVARTSLAQVAERANVPPGNVFYYFRTKDDLVRAVAAEWRRLLALHLEPLDAFDDPWGRLDAFLDQGAALAAMYAAQGCPLAGLARDLRQEGPSFADEAPAIYAIQSEWIARQFAEIGFDADKAARLTQSFMARYHGAIHLTYAYENPAKLTDEVVQLRRWLRRLRLSE